MIRIETPRLLIRSYEYGDEESIVHLIHQNRGHLLHVLSDWVYAIENKEYAQMFIKKMKMGEALKNIFALGVWLKSEQKLVGEIVFFKVDWKILKMEIGSFIDYKYQGQGFITEAKKECVDFFINKYGLKRIEAVCHIDNIATHKVNLKCGFVKETELNNNIIYSITK